MGKKEKVIVIKTSLEAPEGSKQDKQPSLSDERFSNPVGRTKPSPSAEPKLQSVLKDLVPGTVLNEVQLDNGNTLTTPTFISYNQKTGIVLFSVGGLITNVNANDIQAIQLA